jgi:hypothetical protein
MKHARAISFTKRHRRLSLVLAMVLSVSAAAAPSLCLCASMTAEAAATPATGCCPSKEAPAPDPEPKGSGCCVATRAHESQEAHVTDCGAGSCDEAGECGCESISPVIAPAAFVTAPVDLRPFSAATIVRAAIATDSTSSGNLVISQPSDGHFAPAVPLHLANCVFLR